MNLEDGRPDGLAPVEEQVDLISQVRHAAPDLFVNARTDTHWLRDSPDLSDTLRRLEAYVSAGAHGVFVPGLAEPADIRTVVAAIGAPLNVLALAGGRSVAELAELRVGPRRRRGSGGRKLRSARGARRADQPAGADEPVRARYPQRAGRADRAG